MNSNDLENTYTEPNRQEDKIIELFKEDPDELIMLINNKKGIFKSFFIIYEHISGCKTVVIHNFL